VHTSTLTVRSGAGLRELGASKPWCGPLTSGFPEFVGPPPSGGRGRIGHSCVLSLVESPGSESNPSVPYHYSILRGSSPHPFLSRPLTTTLSYLGMVLHGFVCRAHMARRAFSGGPLPRYRRLLADGKIRADANQE
jgi:hypothetical protein